jgi:ribonucleoside-triphosphate reductase (formate)
MQVIKKDGTSEPFDPEKIKSAITKSAQRAMAELSEEDKTEIAEEVLEIIDRLDTDSATVADMHNAVEKVLEQFNPDIAKSYRDYRNYKKEFVHMLDEVYVKSQSIRFIGDKENANTDSTLVATKRCLIFNELNKRFYRKFFMTSDELQACKDGYIYIHDQSARLDTMNCCLCDIETIMKGGFEMGNVWYNEPKSLDVAFDVIGDIILSTASQQYGGFTVPEIDKILVPYAEKSYKKYIQEFIDIAEQINPDVECSESRAEDYALAKVKRDFEQGFQGIEMKLNTVGSSRGDYPFITMTFGLSTEQFGKMASITFLEVHMKGQGKEGNKKPVLFPKLVFLYDKDLHGENCINRDVYEAGIACSAKTMYPDWLSLTGEGYVAEMYKKYKRVVSPMGCRAFLSPWYERGGMKPADENDKPVFVGRFNIGAVSLHLPMILAKARKENKDFYEVLDYYLEMIRGIHQRTYAYLGEMRASINPVVYCEGGFYGGHLNPNDKIKSILKPMTASFGITALNELQELYNHKSIAEDGEFALEVMQHINKKVNEFKEADGWLYAIYGTPGESLCLAKSTEIQTHDGNVPIQDIKEGDLVYTYNEEFNVIELKPVLAATKTKSNAPVLKVTVNNGQEILCTPDHPFAVRVLSQDENGLYIGKEHIEYIQASRLEEGDLLKSNHLLLEANLKVEKVEFTDTLVDVYNLEVADNHNYYVGSGEGVLVHNCGLQIEQFKKLYGIVENVSDRPYVSNSFHCHVTEDINPIQKQDLEGRFWNLMNGGKIQYVRYPISYNMDAIRTLVDRAMEKGFYEGVNLSLAYCDNCGHQELNMDVCPKCGSTNLTKVDRMNGYLAYSRVHGDTRLNTAKMAEIAERKSM